MERINRPKRGYRRVVAFEKADELAKLSYRLARRINKEDRWLASQLRRAALSVPLNIVEGHGRGTVRDFLRFLEQANGSLNEVEYLLDFVVDVEIVAWDEVQPIEPVRREAAATLVGLIKALRKRSAVEKDWHRNLLAEEPAVYYPAGVEDD